MKTKTKTKTQTAALGKPVRNCDKYPEFMSALKMFMNEHGYYAFSAVEWEMFARWLLAEAKEGDAE